MKSIKLVNQIKLVKEINQLPIKSINLLINQSIRQSIKSIKRVIQSFEIKQPDQFGKKRRNTYRQTKTNGKNKVNGDCQPIFPYQSALVCSHPLILPCRTNDDRVFHGEINLAGLELQQRGLIFYSGYSAMLKFKKISRFNTRDFSL